MQYAVHTACRGPRPGHRLAQPSVQRLKVVAEPRAQRGERDAAAGAFEQRRADTALQLLDHLTDPGLGQSQPFSGTAEVQLLGQHEETPPARAAPVPTLDP